MDLGPLLPIAAGFVALIAGAELLVRGASRLAAGLSIPPLVIGLTVVAFGTSAPELAVSLGAALSGRGDIALGNAVGSNIFNVFLILGLSALVAPLAVSVKLVRLDVPLMIGASVLLLVLGRDGVLDRVEGVLLLTLGLAYTVFQVWEGRRESAAAPAAEAHRPRGGLAVQGLLVLAGLGLLVLGARWLVAGASTLARGLGVSELVIGLTVIAAGTSLPEAATSVMASLRGERDIAVGNVVGSNLFNILWVLGATAAASGAVGVPPAAWRFDLPVMLAAALACLPIFLTGLEIARWEGALFFAYYLAYTTLVVLASTVYPDLPLLPIAVLGFVLPIATLGLALLATGQPRRSGKSTPGG